MTHGGDVIGSIPLHGGSIVGRRSGPVLAGTWSEAGSSGRFAFRMAPDEDTFSGSFDDGTWWTGQHVSSEASHSDRDRSTPRAALRSFLMAGAKAQLGIPDAIGGTAMVSRFQGLASGLPIMQQVRVAQDMFNLADATTVALWTIPDAPFDDVLRVGLLQAGTAAMLPLTLQRLQGGFWWVIVPDLSTLAEARRALLARHGGRLPPSASGPRPADAARYAARLHDRARDLGGPGRDDVLATLDLGRLPEATRAYDGELAALTLAHVLARVEQIIPQTVPDDPASREVVILFEHPAGRIGIGPVGEGGKARWQFTDDTIEPRALYVALAATPIRDDAILRAPANPAFALRAAVAATAPLLLWPMGGHLLEVWQILGIVVIVAAALAAAATFVASLSPCRTGSGPGRTVSADPSGSSPSRPYGSGLRRSSASRMCSS